MIPENIHSASFSTRKELFMIPVPMSPDTLPIDVLPQSVLDIVKGLKVFFVENLRSARRFLKAVDREFDIDATEFVTLDEHTTYKDAAELTRKLLRADRVGMISEAGCPGIADPGAMIVEIARANGYSIVPLVGPSSILLGLMASGFNGQNFAFNGYLPYDNDRRKRKLKDLISRIMTENQTQIFIETPYRNNKLIAELTETLQPDMKLCVACDLTSPQEEIICRSIGQWKKATYDFSKRPAIFLLSK